MLANEGKETPTNNTPHLDYYNKQLKFKYNDSDQQMKETRRSPSPYATTIYRNKERDTIEALKKENEQLKKEIVQLRIIQFYQLDNQKLKELIQQVQSLKQKIKYLQEDYQRILIEKDFLERSNRKLKEEREVSSHLLLENRRDTIAKFSNYFADIPEPEPSQRTTEQLKNTITHNNTPTKFRNQSPDRYFRKVNSSTRFNKINTLHKQQTPL